MQLSQLLNPSSFPYEERPKNLIRFARFLYAGNPSALPTDPETNLLLNRQDKTIFVMITRHSFDESSGCIRLTLEQFAVALWKTSLLRQRTRKGRKSAASACEVDPLIGKNMSSADIMSFFDIDDESKELRCMRVWKNLRKYFKFRETHDGWEVYHDAFKSVTSNNQIQSIIRDVLPIKKKSKRRTQTENTIVHTNKGKPVY